MRNLKWENPIDLVDRVYPHCILCAIHTVYDTVHTTALYAYVPYIPTLLRMHTVCMAVRMSTPPLYYFIIFFIFNWAFLAIGVFIPGQLKLKKAKVLVVGAGGLGCPILLYLVNAGVGAITVIDADVVETSNLHRQTLHADDTVGTPKVESAVKFFHRYRV